MDTTESFCENTPAKNVVLGIAFIVVVDILAFFGLYFYVNS